MYFTVTCIIFMSLAIIYSQFFCHFIISLRQRIYFSVVEDAICIFGDRVFAMLCNFVISLQHNRKCLAKSQFSQYLF